LLQFTFQVRDSAAKLIVVDLHEGACGLVGKLCQHRAFVMAYRVAGRMWSVERQPEATQPVPYGNGEDRPL
jgi:hypothetical protein